MKKLVVIFALIASTASADLSEKETVAIVSLGKPHRDHIHHIGTAWFYSPNHLLTANHCVDDLTSVYILVGNSRYLAQVVKRDTKRDLAILYCKSYSSSVQLTISKSVAGINTPVISYGDFSADPTYPKGVIATSGLVSRLRSNYYSSSKSEATTHVWPGFSGGPVLNRKTNEVQGITTNYDVSDYRCIFERNDEILDFIK